MRELLNTGSVLPFIRHNPREICIPGLGYVNPHTTFTLDLTPYDLERLTEYSGSVSTAEKWKLTGNPNRFGSENYFEDLSIPTTVAGRDQPSTEDEAWEVIARKVGSSPLFLG